MKPVAESVYNSVTNDYHNTVGTVVHAEWQMNRYFNTHVDNTPSEGDIGYDIEYFPIESIVKPNRPTSGICKAAVGQAFVEPERHSGVPGARYYSVDADDEYKYWQSPLPTDSTGTFPLFNATNFPAQFDTNYAYDNLTCVRPTVAYITEDYEVAGEEVTGDPMVVFTNKISFTVENTYSYPTDYDVQVRYTTTGPWTTVASNLPVPQDGKVELWYNGTSWTTTKALGGRTMAHAVRLVVRKMYVPATTRTVSLKTLSGIPLVQGGVGAFTQADVGATISGPGIQSGTKITKVEQLRYTGRRFELKNGTVVTATKPPANTKRELDPVITYTTLAAISKPATATNETGVNITVSVVPSGSYFNLIELGLSMEADLTPDVANWQNNSNMGETDFITPLGKISSNGGSLALWNGNEGTYRNKNPYSLYYNMLDKGVLFRGWMKYGQNLVPEFTFFSESWDEGDDTTTVTLVDGTDFFMSTKPRPVLYQNIPVQEIVWRICDIIGFTNYNVTTIDTTATVDIFWTDGEKTAWEIFGDLSRATQTAIYFDSYGVLQVKTRDAAWDKTKGPIYTFSKHDLPGQPANIVSLEEQSQYEANKVTVNWKPTGFSESRDNIVPFEVVWEPDGDLVLRATNLSKNVLKNEKYIYLVPNEGKTWPWKGVMNIEGEWISYNAKQYSHHTKEGVRKYTWVDSIEKQRELDEAAGAFHRHLNHYTGTLRVEQRGLYGTQPADHRIDLNGWTKTRRRNYSTNADNAAGIKLNQNQSSVTITGLQGGKGMDDYTYLHRGNTVDDGYKYLGFRMKIDKTSHSHKTAGMFFSGDGGVGTGYFLDVMATSRMDGKMRGTRNEVMFYSMKANGQKKYFGGKQIISNDKSKNNKNGTKEKVNVGVEFPVVADRYIDFDIWLETGGGSHKVQIWANGRRLMDAEITGDWRHTRVSKMGLFVRGHSSATFDYIYGINSPGVDMTDSEAYYDRIEGGFYSTQASDWTYSTKSERRKVKKKNKKGKVKWVWKKYTKKYAQRFYEEFGPVAHELREFDIKFDSELPVLESKLYFSNTTQAVCTEYAGDISGSKFIMGNISRLPAVLNGDDDRTSQGNGTINQKLFVYGRPVIQKDAQELTVEDDWSIRRRGIIEVEYDSPWIQNKDEAEKFANWLTSHWSRSDSTLEVEVFGNPIIELTDIVKVEYDHIEAHFYVTAITNSFDNGLSTSLTLRKV